MYRVMIVEDEMFVRIGLEHSIDWQNYGMEVVASVSNGIEAYERYEKLKPHLIITDIKMPKMGGIELITKIRKDNKTVRFIILTCMEDFITAKSALDNDVSFYFVKADMNMSEMGQAVESIYNELQKNQIQYGENNLPKSNKAEEHCRFITSDEKNLPNDLLDFFAMKNSNYLIAELLIHDLGSDDVSSSQQRLYKSVIDVLEELLKNQKIGKLLFGKQNKVYFLFSVGIVNGTQEVTDCLQHIVEMIHSYFNLKASALIGRCFSQVNHIKSEFKELTASDFVLFYHTGTVINILDDNWKLYCQKTIELGIHTIIAYYKDNFDFEYSEEFCKYEQLLNDTIVLDTYICKQFFSQWFQLYIAIMYLTSEQMKHNQFEVLDKINKSERFEDIVNCIKEFMGKAKLDEESKQQMSVGLMKAINYIHQNLKQNLTLPLVADKINFSPGYLSYLFTSEMNMSFTNFILKLRIKKAKNMLAQTDDKLYVVAEEVGFSDSGYFNKVFKKSTGMTPSQYRKQNYMGYQNEE